MNQFVQCHRKSVSWWTLFAMVVFTIVVGYCLADHRPRASASGKVTISARQ